MANQAHGEALAQEAALMRRLGLQLTELQEMGLKDLRAKYLDLFGEEAKSKNLPFLRKKVAFRLQERVHGGLAPEVRERIDELAPLELPAKPGKGNRPLQPSPGGIEKRAPRDPRLPEAGTRLTREHKGYAHEVEVLDEGFHYRGRTYRSLSAIAKEIAGTPWNGFTFFGLKKGAGDGQA